VIYYQCYVKTHCKEENTPAGEIVTDKIEKYSVTRKFVVLKQNQDYLVTEYISPYTRLPNRRFSGLKIREQPYWEFTKERSFTLSGKGLQNLIDMESQGREAIEFDYAVTKYTTNQLIIKRGKNFKQLVIENDHLLSATSLQNN
jgi:hypothetical protein